VSKALGNENGSKGVRNKERFTEKKKKKKKKRRGKTKKKKKKKKKNQTD